MKTHWLTIHRLALSNGLTPEAANALIKSIHGTYVEVDESAIDFAFGRADTWPKAASTGEGPGKELSLLLHRLGIREHDCACRSRAAQMNIWGADGSEANIDEIVGWLRESAAARGLPFLDVAARLLVKRAIANARRKEAARVATEAADRPSLRPEQ